MKIQKLASNEGVRPITMMIHPKVVRNVATSPLKNGHDVLEPATHKKILVTLPKVKYYRRYLLRYGR